MLQVKKEKLVADTYFSAAPLYFSNSIEIRANKSFTQIIDNSVKVNSKIYQLRCALIVVETLGLEPKFVETYGGRRKNNPIKI